MYSIQDLDPETLEVRLPNIVKQSIKSLTSISQFTTNEILAREDEIRKMKFEEKRTREANEYEMKMKKNARELENFNIWKETPAAFEYFRSSWYNR